MGNIQGLWANVGTIYSSKENSLSNFGNHVKKEFVIEATIKHSSINRESLFSKSRKREVVMARQACTYIFYKHLGFTTTAASKFFNRDHATTIHSVHRVEDSFYIKDGLFDFVNEIIEKIK